jgi:diguanylate cyclase (GGDEF)-like protein
MALAADDVTARLHAEFPGALLDGQIVAHFQPEVELATGRLVSAEVLARWEHPELGTVQPGSFISLAEELGLMRELTLVMLRQALAQHRAWVAAGWVVPVSVNIGPSCVTDPGFPAAVDRLLREERVPGQMLALELSEETGTTAASTRFFAQLAAADVQISLDDFGTGYASLESLGGWPINELKLDRSIVQPIISSASFRTIVRTNIDLAHQLGLKVVAEGIESAAVSSELLALGCDIGQGFYLGRPMPAAAFTGWLSEPGRVVPRFVASAYLRAGPRESREVGHLASRATRHAALMLRRAVQPTGGAALAVAVVVVALYGLWQILRWGGHQHQALIGDLVLTLVHATAALFAWRVSRRSDLGQATVRAWRLLTLAIVVYLVGGLLRLVYEVGLHERAYSTWADAAYLTSYVVACCGLLSFPGRRRSGAERLRLLLDMGTVFTGGAVLVWYIALGPAVASGLRFDLVDLVTYAFPVGDLVLLYGTLAMLWRGVAKSSVLPLRIFAAGILFHIAADLNYVYLTLHSTYTGGDPVDTLRIVAAVTVCLAAVCQLRARPSGSVAAPLPWPAAAPTSFAPYLAVAGTYLLVLVAGLRSVTFDSLGGVVLGAAVLTVIVAVRQYITLRDYARLAARYQGLAAIDGITGLYNRRHFMETAEAAFARAERLDQPFAVLMIDVDNFKQINDVHGHIAGDQVLARLAQACREYARPEDIVGRYGGDEFIIMVPGITSLRAIQLADQLTRPAAPGDPGRALPPYSVSIGIADCPPCRDLSVLLRQADLAMYLAKHAGGGCWRIFSDAAAAGRAGSRLGHAGMNGEAVGLPDDREHPPYRAPRSG